MLTPPTSVGLYIHIPWCVRKCPYCDFNSHQIQGEIPEQQYTESILLDLDTELERISSHVETIYFGGGTPSLFSPATFSRILDHDALTGATEITMESNPSTLEHRVLSDYRIAGINRLSMGVQSLDDGSLQRLGRIHSVEEVYSAVEQAHAADFDSLNLDLMFGLPDQDIEAAIADLEGLIQLEPDHISWYQLTLEPNTVFGKYPPRLASDEQRADMSDAGLKLLRDAGYRRYEVSAFATSPASECHHNLNYWQFGDYLGIGAGAHGKVSMTCGTVVRTQKTRQPDAYMGIPRTRSERINADDLPVEFMMNALRLVDGVDMLDFERRTGLPLEQLAPVLHTLRQDGLLQESRLALTEFGFNHLDSVVARFL